MTLSLLFIATAMVQVFAQEPWKEARLYDAVAAGKVDFVEAALKAGKNPNMRRPAYGTLLWRATTFKRLDMIKLLLSYGADPKAKGNEDLVGAAIETGRMDILMCLVEAGASVNRPSDACGRDDFLAAAISNGNRDMVKYLLEHGADPNGTSAICDETAFQVAAMKGDLEAMELLLKAGADINHRDCNGMSALMLACQKGQQAAVEFLLAHGADPSFKDGYDRTAETFASQLKGENGEKLRVLCAGKKQ
jgi:hypothetical protein